MKSEIQLSRAQQLWLMLAVLVACLPVWLFLPWWVPAFALLGLGWRLLLLFRGVARPRPMVMVVLGLALLISVLAAYMPPVGVEPMSAVLTGGAGLKYLELDRRRQSLLLIYLCYFIAAIQLIFTQTILMFAVTIAACLVIVAAQHVILQDSRQHYAWRTLSWQPLRLAGRIMLVSVPLALVIFVVAPRIPSFWVVPLQQSQTQTGVSDRMDPGSVASLSQSSAIAFRVSFEGDDIPPASELYWRGVVMSDFDGRAWSVTDERRYMRDGEPILWSQGRVRAGWLDQIQVRGDRWRYDIYMEPSYRPYLFSLGAAQSEQAMVGLARDMTLVYQQPVTQQIRYQVTSALDYLLQPDGLDPAQRARNLALPADANPRTRALVQEWRAQGLGTEDILTQLLLMFRDDFSYTLDPPLYPGRDPIDDFLFDGQSGFCEHFASAAAMVLRAAGVPTRVIGGYQGGELNPYENYLIVRQHDAHAWVEFWQEGQGWVPIDPTAAVALGRIDQGFQQYFTGTQSLLSRFSLDNLRDMPLMNWMRLQVDSLNYLWVRWVVSYDSQNQFDLLERLLGGTSPARIGAFLAGGFALGMGFWWGLNRWRSRPRWQRRADRLAWVYRDKLNRAGLTIGVGETLRQMTGRAILAYPHCAPDLQQLQVDLERLCYGNPGEMPEELERRLVTLQLQRPS